MSFDLRRLEQLIPGVIGRKQSEIIQLFQHLLCLLIIGLLIGLACLPLNLIDGIQKSLFQQLSNNRKCMAAHWSDIGTFADRSDANPLVTAAGAMARCSWLWDTPDDECS